MAPTGLFIVRLRRFVFLSCFPTFLSFLNMSRPEGNITVTTRFYSALSEEAEKVRAKQVSDGTYSIPRWGKLYTEKWKAGGKHDPLDLQIKKILCIVRISNTNGVTKGKITEATGLPEDYVTNQVRELDKMGFFHPTGTSTA